MFNHSKKMVNCGKKKVVEVNLQQEEDGGGQLQQEQGGRGQLQQEDDQLQQEEGGEGQLLQEHCQ